MHTCMRTDRQRHTDSQAARQTDRHTHLPACMHGNLECISKESQSIHVYKHTCIHANRNVHVYMRVECEC